MNILDLARDWIDQDPDPVTRAELRQLIDAGDLTDLRERFSGRLQFGTAGLRGSLGAGPQRMNRVVVARAAAGLAAYLLDHHDIPSIVIGYDARHNSERFARDTAEIMHGAGVRAYLLPTHLPTPVLSFAIRHLDCTAGVMVTASHNPAQDNGYKVYLGDSSQIVPPADAEISAQIDRVGRVDLLPRSTDFQILGQDVTQAYTDAVVALTQNGPRDINAVYSPLHGVGRDVLVTAVKRAGFAALTVVASQAEPDADFPTVTFPNPEEPGAMDLALAQAAQSDADLIVANDPDADRCAVGVRLPRADRQGADFQMLTGDQVGVLLADFLLRRGVKGTYASSIVSSDLLGRLAARHGQRWEQTLTGFKWIGKIADLAFGYEEALGYSVAPHIARDKDGISAILTVLELAAELKAENRTLIDRLDDLYREHGLHATAQLSVRVDDVTVIEQAMATLRRAAPQSLGSLAVVGVDDFSNGYRSLPPTDGIRLGLDGGARVICRPSGTEPKLKCYLEVVVPVTESVPQSRRQADKTLAQITSDLATFLGV